MIREEIDNFFNILKADFKSTKFTHGKKLVFNFLNNKFETEIGTKLTDHKNLKVADIMKMRENKEISLINDYLDYQNADKIPYYFYSHEITEKPDVIKFIIEDSIATPTGYQHIVPLVYDRVERYDAKTDKIVKDWIVKYSLSINIHSYEKAVLHYHHGDIVGITTHNHEGHILNYAYKMSIHDLFERSFHVVDALQWWVNTQRRLPLPIYMKRFKPQDQKISLDYMYKEADDDVNDIYPRRRIESNYFGSTEIIEHGLFRLYNLGKLKYSFKGVWKPNI